MDANSEIITVEPRELSLGSLPINGPNEIITRASDIATALARIINERKLYKVIQGR